jgi:membrane associated rhomboid family serine protease
MSIVGDIKSFFKNGDGLSRLIFVNVAVFVVLLIISVVAQFNGRSIHLEEYPNIYLSSTSNLELLARRPWTIITHMFAHIEVGHFLFNLVTLFTVGKLFRHFLGSKRLVANYILGGLSGFLVYLVCYNVFPGLNANSSILGASAAVMSLIITIGMVKPNYSIKLFGVFEMKLIWLCGILVFVDLISLQKGFNSGGHLGHLGGALYGFLYARNYNQGKNMASWLENLLSRFSSLFNGNRKSDLHTVHKRPKTDEQFNVEKAARQKRIDQILDKISRAGYDSLTKEEKDFLFKYSQK